MKKTLLALFVGISGMVSSQATSPASPDCNLAENVCANNGSNFPLGTNQGVLDIPMGNNISNPTTNPQGVNTGCLLAGELNPNWFVINVGTSGNLEFTIGAAGSNGFFDWALWPFTPGSTPGNSPSCQGIFDNTLPPVACNWNASSAGFTGMWNGGTPPGGVAGNFQPSIPVNAGEAYVLMFSNFSSLTGNAQLSFPTNPGSAGITCQPGTPDQTICLGSSADVTIIPPPTFNNPEFNWLVTNGVSNTSGGVNVQVTPTVTTEYHVEVTDPGLPGALVVDTFTITVIPPHSPDAGPDQEVCFGDIIQLAGVPENPANSVTWTTDVTQVNPTPTVTMAPTPNMAGPLANVNQLGTYLFIFQENNAVCGVRQDTMQLIVSDINLTATATPPSCNGVADGEVHITSAGAVEYSFDGGTSWQPDSFNVVLPAGTYTVCSKSALGCTKCVDVDVIDPAPVVVSVSNDTTVCQNGTANISASATGGTTFDFHWDFTTNTDATQVVNPLSSSIYTVYAENENGCVSTSESITVTVLPALTGTITPWDTICPGYPTDITATVSGGIGQPYDFVWSSGDTQNGPNIHTISANPPQTTTYTVTITDACESTPLVMETNIRVAPLPVPAYEVLDPEQCEPAIFHIVNMTDPTLNQYDYWLFDNEHEYFNQDTIVTPPMYAGSYDLQMIVTTYEGCVDSLTFEDMVTVKPKPVADFKHSPNPVLMFNTEVLFTNYSFNGHTYEWTFEEGFPSTSTQTNVTVQFPDGQTGQYDVQLITTSELGCKDTMDYELVVFPEVLIYAPNTFTPDGDEFNQDWRVYMEGIDIYDFDLLIFDRWGELIWESHDVTVPWDGTVKGRPVPPGTYTWIIRASDMLNDGKYEYNGSVTILR